MGIVWNAERGWHESDQKFKPVMIGGKFKWVPVEEDGE